MNKSNNPGEADGNLVRFAVILSNINYCKLRFCGDNGFILLGPWMSVKIFPTSRYFSLDQPASENNKNDRV